jgi:hypothetical protein
MLICQCHGVVGRHVRAAEDMNMLPTAAFFGEKIVCLPGAKDAGVGGSRVRRCLSAVRALAPRVLTRQWVVVLRGCADVYKLAHIYYKQRHFKRALQVPVCVHGARAYRTRCPQP